MSPIQPDAAIPDRDLVWRMAAGEERALGALYDRHARMVYALAHAVVGERADAEEVVADAFGQAWRSAAEYDPLRGSVGGWLTTIARARALDLVRRRGRRGRAYQRAAQAADGELAAPVAMPEPPDRGVERAEAGALVRRAMAALPDAQRRVIELAYFGGLSQSEIAAELAEPLGTVKTRMRAALEKLRAVLRPLAGEGA